MKRIEKTVFISYRRTNVSWALAIFQDLTHHGYDVFFDYKGIASGDFERIILGNIDARAHFLVLLTPSALDRCSEPGDWFRREIEHAISAQRNIVPLMLDGFDFGRPEITSKFTDSLFPLKRYNALEVYAAYFTEAMARLREIFLNVSLDGVLHPVSPLAQQATKDQQAAASTAPIIQGKELTAQELYQRGQNAASLKDYAQARQWYEKAIAAGSAEAMNNLGLLYDRGQGAKQDYAQARQWYEKAIAAGIAEAMNNLGELYRLGQGVQQDYAQARQWYEKAIAAGSAEAMNNLGFLYDQGQGVRQDYAQARHWYEKAIAAGSAMAMYNLGFLYDLGQGVQQDYAQARQWYEKAIAAGIAEAMNNLGTLYHQGQGVKQDYAQARQWYEKAIAAGSAKARVNLSRLRG
jgi:TPR repeat protein